MEPNSRFIQLRKSRNLSQIEFAKLLGVSQGTIGDIERGRIGISKKVKSKIIEKIGVEAGYFDNENQSKKGLLKQGGETRVRQGKNNLKASFDEFKKRKIDLYEPYLNLEKEDLLYEIDLEMEDLKELHENYRKLLQAIHKIDPPIFFKKKFPMESQSIDFNEYLKWIESEYQPYLDQDEKENNFSLIHKIFKLYKPGQDHLRNMITMLIAYFNRYSDFFLDENGIKDAQKG